MTERTLLLFALASAVVTANAYYIHPIIALVADYFEVSHAMIGMVPAFNQLALAIGIFLLLPLGDRFSNRKLCLIFVFAQVGALVMMAMAQGFALFVVGSTLLGFFTIAPYILPAYVSKRIPVNRLGHATAILTAGIIFGVLVARAGAGIVGEFLGWRAVYVIAAGLMAIVSVLLLMIMEGPQAPRPDTPKQSYLSLILSIFPIIRQHPEILLSGSLQGMSFGVFLSVWMGLGLHLTSPEMGYGVDVVGYLALLTILNLAITPVLGRWADRVGARKARFLLSILQFAGVCLLGFFGHSLWLLIIPILIMNMSGPAIDVAGRMTFLSEAPEIRTRLMTVFIVLMFTGAGIASWAGTAAYDFGGWMGNAVLALGFSLGVLILSFIGWRMSGTKDLRS